MNIKRLLVSTSLSPSPFMSLTPWTKCCSIHQAICISLSAKSLVFSTKTGETQLQRLPQQLNVLNEAHKFRINQLKLIRIGMKEFSDECFREFEIVDALLNTKLLFVKLHYAEDVEKYEMNVYEYGSEKGEVLIRMLLERNHALHTVAARIYSPVNTPIGYVYDLEGIFRTAIIENGAGDKSLFQLHTTNPSGWTKDAKIYSGRGIQKLGHLLKLDGFKKDEIMIYLRTDPKLDALSRCNIIGAVIFLMTYDYLR